MDQLHDNDELNEAPMLRSMSREDPFQVPDGFFDRFPAQVQARIAAGAKSGTGWGLGTIPVWLRASSAAAAMMLIIGAIALFRPTAQTDPIAEEPGISYTLDDLMLDRTELSDLVRSLDDPTNLMAEVGNDLGTDEMALYLEREELPLDMLIDEL